MVLNSFMFVVSRFLGNGVEAARMIYSMCNTSETSKLQSAWKAETASLPETDLEKRTYCTCISKPVGRQHTIPANGMGSRLYTDLYLWFSKSPWINTTQNILQMAAAKYLNLELLPHYCFLSRVSWRCRRVVTANSVILFYLPKGYFIQISLFCHPAPSLSRDIWPHT